VREEANDRVRRAYSSKKTLKRGHGESKTETHTPTRRKGFWTRGDSCEGGEGERACKNTEFRSQRQDRATAEKALSKKLVKTICGQRKEDTKKKGFNKVAALCLLRIGRREGGTNPYGIIAAILPRKKASGKEMSVEIPAEVRGRL